MSYDDAAVMSLLDIAAFETTGHASYSYSYALVLDEILTDVATPAVPAYYSYSYYSYSYYDYDLAYTFMPTAEPTAVAYSTSYGPTSPPSSSHLTTSYSYLSYDYATWAPSAAPSRFFVSSYSYDDNTLLETILGGAGVDYSYGTESSYSYSPAEVDQDLIDELLGIPSAMPTGGTGGPTSTPTYGPTAVPSMYSMSFGDELVEELILVGEEDLAPDLVDMLLDYSYGSHGYDEEELVTTILAGETTTSSYSYVYSFASEELLEMLLGDDSGYSYSYDEEEELVEQILFEESNTYAHSMAYSMEYSSDREEYTEVTASSSIFLSGCVSRGVFNASYTTPFTEALVAVSSYLDDASVLSSVGARHSSTARRLLDDGRQLLVVELEVDFTLTLVLEDFGFTDTNGALGEPAASCCTRPPLCVVTALLLLTGAPLSPPPPSLPPLPVSQSTGTAGA